MRYPRFCGPSTPAQSPLADCERTVNWYVEPMAGSAMPGEVALYPVPGQRLFIGSALIPDVGVRGAIIANGRVFMVIGPTLYELLVDGSVINRGTVANDGKLAVLSYNGIAGGQLFITSGTNGYCYVLATNVLSTVLSGEAVFGGMLSNRFLAFSPTTGKVRLSAQNDGMTWDATLYFQRGLGADPWQAMVVSPPNIWLIGSETGEVWYDSGAYPQPFAPVSGAFFPYGTAAPFSLGVVGDLVAWLSRDVHGAPAFVAARGYQPVAISNFAIENTLSAFTRANEIADAELLTYGDQGHVFACWSFPTAGSTWVFDVPTGAWHERGQWLSAQNRFSVWAPRVHVAAFGQHLVGGRGSGAIGALDPTVGTELDGSAIRRLRVPPPLRAPAPRRIIIDRLQVLLEAGLGTVVGQGADPQLMLRTSGDAKRWGAERQVGVGGAGQFLRHAVFTRCGSSDVVWVPEVSCSDPIPWRLLGCDVQGTGLPNSGFSLNSLIGAGAPR